MVALSPEEIVARFMQLGLIAAEKKCRYCSTFMRIRAMTKNLDGLCWQCVNKEAGCYGTVLSIRHGSVFYGSRCTLLHLFKLLYLWSESISLKDACRLVAISRNTISGMYARIRAAIHARMQSEPLRLGGPNVIVQIDESLFSHKVKYNRGRAPREQTWVFGLVDTSRAPAIGHMEIVPNRSQDTLLEVIARVCRPGTIIHSDEWRAYRNIHERLRFEHRTVNHSLHFVDPVSGVHTQAIESYWSRQKLRIKEMKGIKTHLLPEYLSEFMWKDLHFNDRFSALLSLLAADD